MCTLYTAVHVGGPVQSRWYWVIGSSQHLLSLPRSLCGSVLGGLLCAVSGVGGRVLTQWESVVRKGRDSVLAVVTADKLDVSCVLPALTCWVELCTDHTCIRALGAVGSAWDVCMLYQPYVYMGTDVGRPCFHHIYIVLITSCTVVKQPQQSNSDVLTV